MCIRDSSNTHLETFVSAVVTEDVDRYEDVTGLVVEVFCWLFTVVMGVFTAVSTFTGVLLLCELFVDEFTFNESVPDATDEITELVMLTPSSAAQIKFHNIPHCTQYN